MTRELGFMWVAELLMLLALAIFLRAFIVRRSDRELHMRLGKLGATIVFVGLLVLEALIRGFGWSFPVRSSRMLTIHVIVASCALALLIGLVITGMKGPRAVHVKLWPFFLPLYTASIVLSWFAFALW
jgi:hypothetical protein